MMEKLPRDRIALEFTERVRRSLWDFKRRYSRDNRTPHKSWSFPFDMITLRNANATTRVIRCHCFEWLSEL